MEFVGITRVLGFARQMLKRRSFERTRARNNSILIIFKSQHRGACNSILFVLQAGICFVSPGEPFRAPVSPSEPLNLQKFCGDHFCIEKSPVEPFKAQKFCKSHFFTEQN